MKKTTITPKVPLHYGWIIAFTGTAVLFAGLGLGRFSLGMLLPSMGRALELNYAQMGLIGTANFLGYMVAVVLAGIVAREIGARWTISLGIVLVGGTMILISRASTFTEIMILYVGTGIGTALANMPIMGLVSHWFFPSTRGRAAGIMVSGNGLGFVFSGLFVPWMNARLGAEGWRAGWLALGIISLLIAAIAACLLRNHPSEKDLLPMGAIPKPAASDDQTTKQRPRGANKKAMLHLGCLNLLFGATHAVYATFIVTTMVNERGFTEGAAGNFWAVVGALSLLSGPLFGGLSDRLGRKMGMIAVFTLFTIAYALAGAKLPNSVLYASIGLFALSVWGIPTIMAAAVGDYMGPAQAVQALGFVTLFLGAGQTAGPALAGFLSDMTGTFSAAFWLCAVLTAIAVGLAYLLRQPPKTR